MFYSLNVKLRKYLIEFARAGSHKISWKMSNARDKPPPGIANLNDLTLSSTSAYFWGHGFPNAVHGDLSN